MPDEEQDSIVSIKR